MIENHMNRAFDQPWQKALFSCIQTRFEGELKNKAWTPIWLCVKMMQ